MSDAPVAAAAPPQQQELVLKDPPLAALLSWLVPGLGHLYQGRTGKGVLFMVCILGTYFYGLFLGGSQVVYASWRPEDKRLMFLGQVGVGGPSLPALIQAYRVRNGRAPLWNGFMAPPRVGPANDGRADELDDIHMERNRAYELGTMYTVIAGLLNILAIYDAYGGPLRLEDEEEDDDSPPAARRDGAPPGAAGQTGSS